MLSIAGRNAKINLTADQGFREEMEGAENTCGERADKHDFSVDYFPGIWYALPGSLRGCAPQRGSRGLAPWPQMCEDVVDHHWAQNQVEGRKRAQLYVSRMDMASRVGQSQVNST
jgi:hypothetical protein